MPFSELRRTLAIEGSKLLGAITIILVITSWWFIILNLESYRAADRERTLLNATRINNSLAYSIARVSSELDTLLLFMRAMRNARDKSVTWQEIVTEHYTLNRQTVQIAVIDKNGMMVTSTKMLHPKKPVDLSDRIHYKVHVNSGRDALYISAPVLGRASKEWSIQYTRPLLDVQGAFTGVIVVSLSVDKIIQLFEGANIGRDGGIAVVGQDAIVRASAGRFVDLIGKEVPKELLAAANGKGSGYSNQLLSVQQADNYPMNVIVSIADPGVFGWYFNHRFYLLALVLGTLIIISGALYLFTQHRKKVLLLEERRKLELDREVAVRTSRLKSDFLSVMSHEIRTPLNGILGSLELISTDELPDATNRQIEIARSSGFYLLGLIDDILVFMKSDGGDVKLDEQFHSLRSLLNEISRSLTQTVHRSKNQLVIKVGNDVPNMLKFDIVKLRQVITNLLSNANKFTQRGNLIVDISLVDLAGDRARILFSVKDNGIGIPRDQHAAIFERFTSLDSSLSRRSDGTGLGLTICKDIVHSMKSKIMLESSIGKGSCFAFELVLPVAASGSQDALENDCLEQSDCRGCNILLAEDNETNAYIATEFLSAQDHLVDHARDGNEAIAAAQNKRYDLILMDLSMPGRDGLAAAKAIRDGNNPNTNTPIVALTAHVSADMADQVESAGMNDYLTKPISRKRLLDTVQRHYIREQTPQDSTAELNNVNEVNADSATVEMPIMDFDQLDEFFKNYNVAKTTKLLSVLLEDLARNRSKMATAIEMRDEASARRVAHAILGSSSAVGAERLAAHCREVEGATPSGSSFNWQLCRELNRAIDLTVAEVKKALDKLSVTAREAEPVAV